MTCESDDAVAPELKPETGDVNGDYVRLGCSDDCELKEFRGKPPCPKTGRSLWGWIKTVSLSICLVALAVVVFVWVGPIIIDKAGMSYDRISLVYLNKMPRIFTMFSSYSMASLAFGGMSGFDAGLVVIPSLDWVRHTFSMPQLVVVLFASVALFPALLLPSAPSMWVAGMTFGYGFGFLLIMAGLTVGMSLPYFIGSCFRHKIDRWLARWPKKAAFIRLAGERDWFHQFRAVTLLRISPFPYIILNYAIVATNVTYGPYILGSLVGMVPDVLVVIYSGILIWTLAEASQEHRSLTTQQTILNAIGFCFTVATTIISTVYAKKKLNELKEEDEQLLE